MAEDIAFKFSQNLSCGTLSEKTLRLLSREVRKLPFFLYAYVDEDIIVARGRSGGLALWVAADAKWQADSGVLQVLK